MKLSVLNSKAPDGGTWIRPDGGTWITFRIPHSAQNVISPKIQICSFSFSPFFFLFFHFFPFEFVF